MSIDYKSKYNKYKAKYLAISAHHQNTPYTGSSNTPSNIAQPDINMFGGSNMGAEEFEARWLNVDVEQLRRAILDLGAKLVHSKKLYRRYAYSLANQDADGTPLDGGTPGFGRIREEYLNETDTVVTATVKLYKNKDFPEEYEIVINDTFENANTFMLALQLKPRAYQETYREKYSIEGCNEIVIDTIPGLAPYVEIDCLSKERVFDLAAKLGFKPEDAHYGSFARTFREVYSMPESAINHKIKKLTFENAEEVLLEHAETNKDVLVKVARDQAANHKLYMEQNKRTMGRAKSKRSSKSSKKSKRKSSKTSKISKK